MLNLNDGYVFVTGEHKQAKIIWIQFEYDKNRIAAVRQINGKWSQSKKCWYVPDNKYFRALFHMMPNMMGKDVLPAIFPINRVQLQHFLEELQLKSYSASTIKTYSNEFAQLLYLLKNVPVRMLSYDKLRSYLLYCVKELKMSDNHLHSRINAIKFYFEQVLKREKFMIEIPRPKKPSILPKVLSQKDIEKLFRVTTNDKHLLMLQLCYGMGLRVSEVVGLKVVDIDSSRMQVLIQSAKGKKDRYVHLPQTVLTSLRKYYKDYKPKKYLFEGQYGGQYSIRSVQMVFKAAMKKAGIKKPVGIHGLRHSYATHLLERGTDISFIQKLLGHNDIKTTLRYTHVATTMINNISSPLDSMNWRNDGK